MKVDATGPTLAEPGAAAAPVPAGSTLGKYRLDRVIGEGGMGVVWAGYDPDLERAVAIKVLRDAGDTTLRTRLLREARAMARLKHPNVLTVYEVGTDSNRDYIAMDLVDGGDLSKWLTTRPPRKDIFDALIGAGRGLAAAHDAGLIHRDFKPHNVLRSNDARVYVTDFGLARGQLEPEVDIELVPMRGYALASGSQPRRPIDSVLDAELTQTGILIGTPAYMAPEQYAGLVPDPRTDQFSFCVTAWEALSGSRPFAGDSLEALRNAVGGGVAKTPAELPSSVRAVLTRGLDPEPSKRWPDMRSLLAALERIATPRRRIAGVLVVVGAVLVATGVTFAVMHRDSNDSKAPVSGHCAPADEAFGSAWSVARRDNLRKAHPQQSDLFGSFAVLDQVRREWINAYDKACALPASAHSLAQVACLLGVRDEVVEETRELDSDEPEGDVGSFAMKIAGIKSCANE